MQLWAPAKINLSFEIKSKRADGYHDIETLMAPISLADRLTIEARPRGEMGIEFSCDDPSLPVDDDNLVVRAARLFQEATGISAGVKITLEKKIPHGAGLGGGSSDAASALLGLNELFATGLDQNKLIELGTQLGSDVPFFIARSPAICRGRGEIVVPTDLSQNFQLLLIKPEFGIPTPWAYGRWKDSREIPGVDYAPQEFGSVQFVNDLERPVFEKYVFLGYLKTWLREQPGVGAALLSGSGSTVFAVLREGIDGESLAALIRSQVDPSVWTHLCATQSSFPGVSA